MEKLLVVLQGNTAFELSFEGGFDFNALNQKLNSRDLNVLAIGEIIAHKSTIKYIKRIAETFEIDNFNINIVTHDDTVLTVRDENYSPIQLEKEINNYEVSFVMIGDTIVNKSSIKTISPIK